MILETFDWLEKSSRNENPVFDELTERIRSFLPDLDATLFGDYLARINGKSTTVWALKDLPMKGKSRSNIGLLCQDFLGYLRHHDGAPFTKGRLACFDIADYLLERHSGELTSRTGGKEAKRVKIKTSHILCPDAETLDVFLSQKMSMFSKRVYKVGAILELIPVWLRFLEFLGLLDHDQKEDIFKELMFVQVTWQKILTKLSHDQALLSGVSTAWSA